MDIVGPNPFSGRGDVIADYLADLQAHSDPRGCDCGPCDYASDRHELRLAREREESRDVEWTKEDQRDFERKARLEDPQLYIEEA